VSDPQQLAPLRADWDRLAGDAPFRQFDWAQAWWESFGLPRRELFVLVIRSADEQVVGIAPWYREHSLVHGDTLAFLGDEKACGDDLSLLVDPAATHETIVALADWLHAQAVEWDQLRWDGVTCGDPRLKALADLLTEDGSRVVHRADASRWVLDLPPTWDDYVASLGQGTRRIVRKALATLADPGAQIELVQPRSVGELDDLFTKLVVLHQQRWTADGEPGVFACPQFTAFLTDVAQRWYRDDRLRLNLLQVAGVPAAATLSVHLGSTTHVYLLGRDPQFDAIRPGWMLNALTIRAGIEGGVQRFDFLRGDEPYKARLGARPVGQCHLRVTSTGKLNRLRFATASLRNAAADAKRALEQRKLN
jgi:CelD/BcsL family acetyltransferase involved in cellulose biosynthesis